MAGSRWDEIVRSHLDGPVDKHFGERVVIMPMVKSPNGRSSVDPDRAVVTCTAIFTKRPHRPAIPIGNRPVGRQGRNDLHSIVEGTLPKLSVSDSAFASGARPRQGDRVDVAGELFEVVSARHDDVSRYVLELVAIGGTT